MMDLWLREEDKNLFEEACKIELDSYRDDILTGKLDNEGLLAKIGKKFVLGKHSIWKPKDSDQEYPFVRIRNSSSYSNGLILTPYSAIDVEYHLGVRTIDKKTKFERVELTGSDGDDFVERAFNTYYNPMVHKWNEKDQHFLLYSVRKQ